MAFIAQPTSTCSGFDCTALGPVRVLLRDLATGALINLESQVRFTTAQGVADGGAWLSPNGRTLAFSSRADYPQAGDTNSKSDMFALDIASGNVQLVSTDAAGQQLTVPGFAGSGPTWGVQAFLSNSSKIAFYSDNTSAEPAGVYVKDLATGALVNAATLTNGTVGNGKTTTNVLLSRDGRAAAFGSNSTNLLGGVSPLGGAELRAYRKLLP